MPTAGQSHVYEDIVDVDWNQERSLNGVLLKLPRSTLIRYYVYYPSKNKTT